MAEGYEVEVLKTLKANGENVQVSYVQDLDEWIISSKNVGMMVRSKDDIKGYKGGENSGRYEFASEMAVVWFNILAKMDPETRVQIKKELNGRTLVGEYIGSQEHQHLVKYSRVTIIFYAVVDNYSEESCWPCSRSWAFFKKYNLDMVHIQSLGTFGNYGKLCDQLETTFKDVAKSTIAQDEEGNVLYFIKKAKHADERDHVISLAKLKTLEYRLFRKMREKLRNFFAAKKGQFVDVK